jgi:hypothetical protein
MYTASDSKDYSMRLGLGNVVKGTGESGSWRLVWEGNPTCVNPP